MNNEIPRKVSLSTIFKILMKKPIPTIFGICFTLVPLILIIIGVIISLVGNEVDYELINSKGKELTAMITNLKIEYNTTINGVNPSIISYSFIDNGKEKTSQYEILEKNVQYYYEVGSEITIKEYQGNTIIKGVKPYKFPIVTLFLISFVFLFVGLAFNIFSFIKAKKEYYLYKNGSVSKGKIVTIIPIPGIPVLNIGRGLVISYEYECNGTKIIDESFITDVSVVSNKKSGDLIPIFVSTDFDEDSCVISKLESIKNNWGIQFE